MSFNDFEIKERLGQGAYSKVYLVRRNKDGCEYALKKVKISKLQEKEIENALNEIRILASISHPNIVEYKEAFLE
jgi:NIMA (never in mitosis gene a)-related kinase